ncbi:MAG: phage portal protein [Candidatus Binatia bacterium]
MGLIRRIADYLDPAETRNVTSWDLIQNGIDLAGAVATNPRAAENLSTVLACVSAISSAMASLPAYVYRFSENGRSIDDVHPVSRLIELGPNAHQTWADWLEWVMASVLLRGNALAEIITDERGAAIGLKPIPWNFCSVQLLPGGRLVYDVTDVTYLGGGTGRLRRLLQSEVFHLRDRSDDGLIGVSRLRRAAAVVQAGLSIQDFANHLYANGVNPSGALEVDGKLNAENRAALRKHFEEGFSGTHNTARALILDQGLKWKQISINPEDAEFLASRRFTGEELARVFGVPPPIIGDLTHGTFTNTETVGRWFAMHTLSPWIRKMESEFSRSVFSESTRRTHRLEIDMSGFLRGDPAQRWAAWKIAADAQILTVNEIRAEEGFNPLPAASP